MKNVAIILGSFHKAYMIKMLEFAKNEAELKQLNIVEEIWVPGSMEKPIMIKKIIQREDIHGIAVLGIIEKGETKHGIVMAESVIDAIIRLQLEFMKPIGLGIIGPEVYPSQIASRIESYSRKAISAVSEMIEIL